MRKRLTATSAILWICATTAAFGAEATAVMMSGWGASRTITVETSERVDFRVFSLVDPLRIVVDFPGLDGAAGAAGPIAPGGVVRAVRFGVFKPGASRMVVDLSDPARIERAFTTKAEGEASAAFVLKLAPDTREAFEARA
ncbi:MAG: AMIN domain-containing protein, partial [Pseudomonadota bacterium]